MHGSAGAAFAGAGPAGGGHLGPPGGAAPGGSRDAGAGEEAGGGGSGRGIGTEEAEDEREQGEEMPMGLERAQRQRKVVSGDLRTIDYFMGKGLDRIIAKIAHFHSTVAGAANPVTAGAERAGAGPPAAAGRSKHLDVAFFVDSSRPKSDERPRVYASGFNVARTGGADALTQLIASHLAGDVSSAYEKEFLEIVDASSASAVVKEELKKDFFHRRLNNVVRFFSSRST